MDRADQPLHLASPARWRHAGMLDMIDFAHRRIDHWLALSLNSDRNDYKAAVALLRAIYDMVDRVKAWETDRDVWTAPGRSGCARETLDACTYHELEARLGIATGIRMGGCDV